MSSNFAHYLWNFLIRNMCLLVIFKEICYCFDLKKLHYIIDGFFNLNDENKCSVSMRIWNIRVLFQNKDLVYNLNNILLLVEKIHRISAKNYKKIPWFLIVCYIKSICFYLINKMVSKVVSFIYFFVTNSWSLSSVLLSLI